MNPFLKRQLLLIALPVVGSLSALCPLTVQAQNTTQPCAELSKPVAEKLQIQSQSYHDSLKKKALELCSSASPKTASTFYRNGAIQLGGFLTQSALELSEECKALVKASPLLPLQRIPNLQDIFSLEAGYDICAKAENSAPTDSKSSSESIIDPTQETREEKRQRYEAEKASINRMQMMGATIPLEVWDHFHALDKELGIPRSQ